MIRFQEIILSFRILHGKMQNEQKINSTVLFANANVTVKESKIPVYSLQP